MIVWIKAWNWIRILIRKEQLGRMGCRRVAWPRKQQVNWGGFGLRWAEARWMVEKADTVGPWGGWDSCRWRRCAVHWCGKGRHDSMGSDALATWDNRGGAQRWEKEVAVVALLSEGEGARWRARWRSGGARGRNPGGSGMASWRRPQGQRDPAWLRPRVACFSNRRRRSSGQATGTAVTAGRSRSAIVEKMVKWCSASLWPDAELRLPAQEEKWGGGGGWVARLDRRPARGLGEEIRW
jgi:hypothetical protein